MSHDMNINRGSGATTPSSSEQAKYIKALEAQWASDLQAASTISKAKPSEGLKGETQPMQTLAPPAGTGGNENAILSYLQFAQLLSMLEYMQAQASQELTMTGSDLSVSQAQAGVGAAQSTYTSDIAEANSMEMQAIGQICTGALVGVTALAAGGMDLVGSIWGTTEEAAVETTTEAGNVGRELPSNDEVEMDDLGGDDEEVETVTPAQRNVGDDDEDADPETETEKEKDDINKLKESEKTGGDPNAVKDSDSANKSSWRFNTGKGSTFAYIRGAVAKAQTAENSISGLFTGTTSFAQKAYKEVSATYKSSATLSNVIQQLASAAYQSTTTTVKSLDETKEAALQMRQQEKQYRAEVSKGYQG